MRWWPSKRAVARNTGDATARDGGIANTGILTIVDGAGLLGQRPLVAADSYFAPYLRSEALFNHCAPLVGRQIELGEALAALRREGGPRLVIIEGQPGRGKSRLALEVLRDFTRQERQPRRSWRHPLTRPKIVCRPAFALAGPQPVDPSSLEELPDEPTIILAEIHRANVVGLEVLLHHARRTTNLRLLITALPAVAENVHAMALDEQFDTVDIVRIRLEPLTIAQGRELVQAIQGDLPLTAPFVEYLAESTRETPFVAVAAIALIRRRELAPSNLSLNATFTEEIMRRYGSVAVTDVSGMDRNSAEAILALCAALAPVNLDDDVLLDAMAAFRSISRQQLLQQLTALANHGSLTRQSRFLRVVPDVLADELQARQAIELAVSTGWVQDVWRHFEQVSGHDLLRNLAYLDWRINRRAKSPTNTGFEDIWSQVSADALAADSSGRNKTLVVLSDIAATQPARVLALTRDLLASQSAAAVLDDGLYQYLVSADVVAHNAGPILRTCAVADPRLLSEALDLLWQLAKADKRAPNQHGQHPARLLEDMAALGNPNASNTADVLLDRVSNWLRTPDAPEAPLTPVTVLGPLLAKGGYTQEWRPDEVLAFRPYAVAIDQVRILRQRVRAILRDEAHGTDIRRAVEAVNLLGDALSPPGPERAPRDEEPALAWEADNLATLDLLDEIATTTTEPLVRLAIRKSAAWHVRYDAATIIRDRCTALILELDRHVEDILTDTLLGYDGADNVEPTGERGRLTETSETRTSSKQAPQADRPPEDSQPALGPIERMLDRRRRECVLAAEQLWIIDDVGLMVAKLTERITAIAASRATTSDSLERGLEDTLIALLGTRPETADAFIKALAESGVTHLHRCVHVPLDALADRDAAQFVAELRQVLSSGQTGAAMGAILGYLRHPWVKKTPASAEVLREALNHPEPEVARLALAGVGELLRADPTQLSDRLKEQAATAAWPVITALDSAANFNAPGWIADLDAAQQNAVLDIIFAIDDIWPFSIDQILAAIAHHRPVDVLHRLSDRHKDRLPPLHGYHNLPAALSGHAAAISDWIAESAQNDDESAFYQHRLFPLIAGDPITADAIQAITTIASRNDARELTFLSGGLSHCSGFALNHPEVVATLLEAFLSLTSANRQKCRALLQNSTAHAGWNTTSQLCNIRDRAAALAETGSFPAELQDFYSEIAIHWQAVINRESEIPPERQ